ncbi:hypothetical protein Nizo2766_0626 [Lactiplantibacillus plantarum]|nr:SH3 domain-containing protein [Lactiplantibacillus plantarum]KZU45422.1 hypothetical protein Nizo2757_1449 [Lactiplantibacillus plantarum]KZU47877.1 hypothetical protein Nizo2766_0626 [Lactiplantibacillus plantarum]
MIYSLYPLLKVVSGISLHPVVGQYYAGESVYYIGTVSADGYQWLKYLSNSGAYHYVAKIG